ncbi:iron reductase [Daedaleopsis nitida]|nr:iron reductase [Daedaleopsis nitida]
MAIWVERNQLYAKQVWWLISSFIILVSAGQLGSWVASKAFSRLPASSGMRQVKDVEDRARVSRPRKRDWSRLPLALVNYFRVFAFRNTIDIGPSISVTYAEALITTAYIIAMFTWEFVNTTNLAGSKLDWQYWSTRAGTLAVSQFPLITVLGTKNNLLAYITGGRSTLIQLNFVHRMTARVTFILLWVHGGSKLILLPPVFYETWFIRVGLTALVAFTLLVIVAFRPIRARFYEFFFFTHFALVLILLVGAYAHANQAARLGPYIIPCFFIWGADRALRLLRLAYFNPLPFCSQGGASEMRASVELLSPQFAAFLLVPGVARVPLEAHPFTIASVDSRYRLAGAPEAKLGRSMTRYASETSTVADGSKEVLNGKGRGDNRLQDLEELVFFINVREGFTKRLADAARRGEEVNVLVDGPYGFSPNLKNDDTVVLVAGGSGVSLALSTFLGVVSDVQRGISRCSRAVFIWSIRDPKQLDWISDSLAAALQLAPPTLEIAIRVFVTGRPRNPDPTSTAPNPNPDADDRTLSSALATPAGPRTLTSFQEVQVGAGRPDIPKILKDEVGRSDAGSRLSVTVCGSAAVANVCRDALCLPFAATLDGAPSVVLHVESFGYA